MEADFYRRGTLRQFPFFLVAPTYYIFSFSTNAKLFQHNSVLRKNEYTIKVSNLAHAVCEDFTNFLYNALIKRQQLLASILSLYWKAFFNIIFNHLILELITGCFCPYLCLFKVDLHARVLFEISQIWLRFNVTAKCL